MICQRRFLDVLVAWLSSAVWSLALAAQVAVGFADDAGSRRTFDLPAQPAESALPRFAAQSRTEVLFGSQAVEGVRTNAVHGEMSVREALSRLLAGTGLSYSVNEGSGALTVTRNSARAPVPKGPGVVAPRGDHPDAPVSTAAAYTGLKTELATVEVPASESVTHNFELMPATAEAGARYGGRDPQ